MIKATHKVAKLFLSSCKKSYKKPTDPKKKDRAFIKKYCT
ncbi:MAG: hypothetical protein OJF59_003172 [Cytophagales bacterium]|nr:MAG: hypothetical protein OJF59_003172 [Cytophagales bacterium]